MYFVTYTYVYTYAIHACMCEVRIYLYRVLYALAMDWSPFGYEIPAIMESYGMAWYLLSCYIMLNYIVCFVFYHYCVVFKLFTRSYKLCSKFDCPEKWLIHYVSYYVKVRVSCLFSAWSI